MLTSEWRCSWVSRFGGVGKEKVKVKEHLPCTCQSSYPYDISLQCAVASTVYLAAVRSQQTARVSMSGTCNFLQCQAAPSWNVKLGSAKGLGIGTQVPYHLRKVCVKGYAPAVDSGGHSLLSDLFWVKISLLMLCWPQEPRKTA